MYWVQLLSLLNGRVVVTEIVWHFLEQAAHMPFPSPPGHWSDGAGASGRGSMVFVPLGLRSGSWTSRHGVAGCGSLQKGRWPTSSWRTGPQVKAREACSGLSAMPPTLQRERQPGPDGASRGSWEPVLEIEDPSAPLSLLRSPTFSCSSHCPQVLKGVFLAKHLFFWRGAGGSLTKY